MTIWLVILILSVIIEIVTIDLVSIWISLGSLGALIAYFLGFDLIVQIIVCLVITVLSFIITRPIAKKYLTGNIVHTNTDRLIGKQGLVTKEIQEDTKGEVKVMGSTWSAISIDKDFIEAGTHVEILAIDGVKLVVKKV